MTPSAKIAWAVFLVWFFMVLFTACGGKYVSTRGLTGEEATIQLAMDSANCESFAMHSAGPVPTRRMYSNPRSLRSAQMIYQQRIGRLFANCMTAHGWETE